MPGTIYSFMRDDAFRNLSNPLQVLSVPGSPFQLSDRGLSFFASGQTWTDTRASRTWLDGHDATTHASLIFDEADQPDLGYQLSDFDEDHRDQFFGILDRIFVLIAADEEVETIETDLDADFSIYVADSLTLATGTRLNATAYNSDDTVVSTPDWAQFSIQVTVEAVLTTFDFKVWVSNTAFVADYPISTISEVIPALGYNAILTGPLTGGGTNAFETAVITAGLAEDALSEQLPDQHQTGFHLQNVRLYDGGGVTRLFPFGILHKGPVPSLLSIRTALRERVLDSGFGNEASWRARVPELFITDQFYIIPMWQAVTALPDGEVNPSVVSIAETRAMVKLALPALDGTFIDQYLEVLSVVYNSMQVAAVPNPNNINYDFLMQLYPTYQNHAASEPGFANMATAAKNFSIGLNAAMAVASGATQNDDYPPRAEGDNTYVPFVIGVVEHYVITKENYLNNIGE